MSRKLAVTLTLAAVGILAALLLLPSQPEAEGTPKDPAATAPGDRADRPRTAEPTSPRGPSWEAGADRVASDAPAWQVGMQVVYDVELRQATRFEASEELQQELGDIVVSLKGRWLVTVVAVEDDHVHLQAALGRPRLTVQPHADTAQLRSTRRDLAGRYYFTVSRSGRVEALHFPASIEPLARSLQKGLVALFQVTRPPETRDAWEVEEPDLNGEAIVRYAPLPGDAGLGKEKLRYVRLAGVAGLVDPTGVGSVDLTGQAQLRLDEAGWVRQLAGKEALTIAPEGGLLSVTARTEAHMTALQRRHAPGLAKDFPGDRERLVTTTLVDGERLGGRREDIDRAWVAGRDLTTLVRQLEALDGDARSAARGALIPQLGALFRLEPERIEDAVDYVRRRGDTPTSSALIAALANAGTPEAQEALAGLAGTPGLAAPVRTRSVALLGLADGPTAESGETLATFLDSDLPNGPETAALALGNHVKRATQQPSDDSAAEAAADHIETLLALLQAAQTPDARILYLEALGNTGDARALPAILEHLRTLEANVRAAALWALRFMEAPPVNGVLVEALDRDPDLAPRLAVVRAAAFRPMPPLVAALDRAARNHPAKTLRAAVVQLLATRRQEHPAVARTLEWVAANDPDPEVRAMAEGALKPSAIPGPVLHVSPSP